MTRRQELEKAVIAAMAAADGKALEWGVDDCAMFAANATRPVLIGTAA